MEHDVVTQRDDPRELVVRGFRQIRRQVRVNQVALAVGVQQVVHDRCRLGAATAPGGRVKAGWVAEGHVADFAAGLGIPRLGANSHGLVEVVDVDAGRALSGRLDDLLHDLLDDLLDFNDLLDLDLDRYFDDLFDFDRPGDDLLDLLGHDPLDRDFPDFGLTDDLLDRNFLHYRGLDRDFLGDDLRLTAGCQCSRPDATGQASQASPKDEPAAHARRLDHVQPPLEARNYSASTNATAYRMHAPNAMDLTLN